MAKHYFYGLKLHEYLTEMRSEAFEPYNAFTISEMPGFGIEAGKQLTSESQGRLDMFFSLTTLRCRAVAV